MNDIPEVHRVGLHSGTGSWTSVPISSASPRSKPTGWPTMKQRQEKNSREMFSRQQRRWQACNPRIKSRVSEMPVKLLHTCLKYCRSLCNPPRNFTRKRRIWWTDRKLVVVISIASANLYIIPRQGRLCGIVCFTFTKLAEIKQKSAPFPAQTERTRILVRCRERDLGRFTSVSKITRALPSHRSTIKSTRNRRSELTREKRLRKSSELALAADRRGFTFVIPAHRSETDSSFFVLSPRQTNAFLLTTLN